MREVADCIHGAARHVAVFDRRRKQDEAGRLQAAWLRWELSTFDYLMRVRHALARVYKGQQGWAPAGRLAALGAVHFQLPHACALPPLRPARIQQ